mmetsp:Transcript_97825/g.276727  ORF Transcript_97825/g.276727 Transcript_97825/m.276727 type:complete len:365 (+) Transcript_97825:58-1152(+)
MPGRKPVDTSPPGDGNALQAELYEFLSTTGVPGGPSSSETKPRIRLVPTEQAAAFGLEEMFLGGKYPEYIHVGSHEECEASLQIPEAKQLQCQIALRPFSLPDYGDEKHEACFLRDVAETTLVNGQTPFRPWQWLHENDQLAVASAQGEEVWNFFTVEYCNHVLLPRDWPRAKSAKAALGAADPAKATAARASSTKATLGAEEAPKATAVRLTRVTSQKAVAAEQPRRARLPQSGPRQATPAPGRSVPAPQHQLPASQSLPSRPAQTSEARPPDGSGGVHVFGAADIGYVLDIDYPSDACVFRVKVTGYNAARGWHNVDSTGYSLWEGEAFTDEVDLNAMHAQGLVKFVDCTGIQLQKRRRLRS